MSIFLLGAAILATIVGLAVNIIPSDDEDLWEEAESICRSDESSVSVVYVNESFECESGRSGFLEDYENE